MVEDSLSAVLITRYMTTKPRNLYQKRSKGEKMTYHRKSLVPHRSGGSPEGPVVLLVMDGIGVGRGDDFDAVSQARTPIMDALRKNGLYRELSAHGKSVGLMSDADMGNSEVGHNTLGAGRIFDQGAKRIDKAIESGAIWAGTWKDILAHIRAHRSTLHLIGLLSDGGIHASITHLFALINRARSESIGRVRIHVLLDGRDVPDHTADQYIARLEDYLVQQTKGTDLDYRIASGGGRMTTTMDRYEADWRIVENGWRAHVLGGARAFQSAATAINQLRAESPGISDQLLSAFTVVDDGQKPIGPVKDGDAVVMFNFRGDRAIELSRAFTEDSNFTSFDRQRLPADIIFAGLTLYDGDTNIPDRRLVEPQPVPDTISEYLMRSKVTQLAVAETQKFGHVTYFWNGNRSEKFDETTEEYVEVSSDQVPFNERPWMKSAETANVVIEAIQEGRVDFVRANFAGGDMVGHTGDFEATIIAVEAVDLAIGRIHTEVRRSHGCLVVTGDHGNAEDMVERDNKGNPTFRDDGTPRWKTSHSVNPVPLFITDYSGRQMTLRDDLPKAGLANVAATLIELLGFEPPSEFEPSVLTIGDTA
jgi:2,3-bisphosphoglycerate-independent phosphoglycerate mutase